MSDPFIDALHDRLKNAAASGTAGQRPDDAGRTAALTRWWEEFVDVVGQKVGAWNERQAPQPPLNFTKRADHTVHVWHRSAEATLTRDGDDVRVSTRLGAGPEQHTRLSIRTATEGRVIAFADGTELQTPAAAAEHVLTPVLAETFASP